MVAGSLLIFYFMEPVEHVALADQSYVLRVSFRIYIPLASGINYFLFRSYDGAIY